MPQRVRSWPYERRTTSPRLAALLGRVVLAMCLVAPLAACTSLSQGGAAGGRGAAVPPPASATPTATPTDPAAGDVAARRLALTGEPATEEARERAVVAVPLLARRPAGRLQGVKAADVVVEELPPSGPAHLLALFHSRDARAVGPVARARPLDPKIASLLHPVYGHRGDGPTGFLDQVAASELVDVPYRSGRKGYRRGQGAQGKLFANTAALRAAAEESARPPPLFSFAREGGVLARRGLVPASRLRVRMPGRTDPVWRYDDAVLRWRRTGGFPDRRVANVIVQEVPYQTVSVRLRPGSREPLRDLPLAQPYGTGRCLVVSGGFAVRCTWHKPGQSSVTNYLDEARVPVRLQPGPTWVLLVPPGTQSRVR